MLIDITSNPIKIDHVGHRQKGRSGLKVFNPKGWKHLRKQLGTLEKGCYHHFTTDGQWSAIHLFEYLLEQCGTSSVWFTSWSISENSIRRMVALKENGAVTSYKALLDRRVKIYAANAYSLALRHIDITLRPIHAKVTVIKGDKLQLIVNQSANYNDNKRVETGIVSTCEEDVNYYINWIENFCNDGE